MPVITGTAKKQNVEFIPRSAAKKGLSRLKNNWQAFFITFSDNLFVIQKKYFL